jgi:tetratricopeptide (TPR) repeat protein/predicted Ser/Thr protein kinase
VSASPAHWIDRVADSLAEHEERRSSLLEGPPRYEILGEISRGGMGIIYRAWDPQLGRDVALKVLQTDEGNSAEAHERFQREARLAAGLHHPHIVPIYDTGTWDGRDYIAMQLIDGTTLDKAQMDLRSTLALVRDAARALHYAHQQGIVHRDVKPSNLLIDVHGRVYVTDFGVARQSQVSATMTSPGTVVGTPAYMSPEQALGMPTDARSDVYSIGATIYEMATGRPPYTGRDAVEVVIKVQSGDFDTPRKVRPELSRNVEAIILGAMERIRDERYGSAAELADDIDRYLQNERPLRRPRGTAYRVRREFVRHPWRSTAAIVFCVLLVLAGTALGYWIRGRIYWNRAQSEPDPDRRKAYLKEAEHWVKDAADMLAQIRAAEQESKVAELAASEKDRRIKEEALAEEKKQREQNEERIRKLKEANDAEEKRRLVAETYAAALKSLGSGALPESRRSLEALKAAAPAKYEELLPKLRQLEFNSGLEQLDQLAAKLETDAYAKLHSELSGDLYASQAERNRRLAESALRLGLRLAERGRQVDAVRWFDTAELQGLRDGALYEKRGLALIDLEQWDLADRDFMRMLGFQPAGTAYAPKFARIAHRKGRVLSGDRRYTEALREFEIALRIDPTLAAAYHDRGLARHYANGQSREALEQDLKSALDLDPALKPAREYRNVTLAFSRSESARLWGADSAADRAAGMSRVVSWLSLILEKAAPDDAELFLERARARRRLGELPGALADARASLQAGGGAESQAGLALITYLSACAQNKNEALLREALAQYAELERLERGSARAAYGKGLCRRALGDGDGALADFGAAEAPDRPAPHLSLQLARLRLDRKEWPAASEASLRALSAASSLSEEEFVGGLYELQKLSRADAIRLIGRDAHLFRGQAAFESGDNVLCIEECKEAIRLDPRHASAFLWRGYARCKEKRHKEAQEDFKETVRLSTYDSEKDNAAMWLERCSRHTKD